MDDRKVPDPTGQPAHGFHIAIWPEPDGCRSFVIRHVTHDEWIRILRAARSAGIPLPDDLEAGMHRDGDLGTGGRPLLDFDAHLAALHRAFDDLKQRPRSRRPTHADCCHEIGEEYETSKQRFTRRGTSWRKETRNW